MTLYSSPAVLLFSTSSIASLLLAATLSASTAQAGSLDVAAGTMAVHVTAVSNTIFRISVNNAAGVASPQKSVFLDPKLKVTDEGQHFVVGDHHEQLKTNSGAIDIDTKMGTYSLLDAHGAILIQPATIATMTSAKGASSVQMHIGWPADRPFDIYACGNGSPALIQHKIETKLGNGIAVEPFFWSPAGFASFAVSNDDNAPARCDGKIQDGSVAWTAAGSSADVYLVVAPTLGDASKALLHLTGQPPVPPRWTFGYMQSRWGWKDQAYVDDALHQFVTRKLPVDAFIFDFEWYTATPDYKVQPEGIAGFPDFGWNDKLFADLSGEIKTLHEAGVQFVGIRKPRLGDSQTLAEIRSKGWDFKGANSGTDARGILFDNPNVRNWYAEQLAPLLRSGVDGWWNDEGEFSYTNYLYWNEAQRDSLDSVRPNARLWTINRAFQPGLSRLGATAWTGDIHSTWKAFQQTPTSLLNWSVSGMPYGACDIGGFRGEVTPELLVRWMEAGIFFPIMRTHSALHNTPHFPWLFGTEAEAAIKKSLDLRYKLVPTLYSLAHVTQETGEPIMQPLLMQYPHDMQVADLSSEWLIGHNLLAAPVLEEGGHKKIYLPEDIWYDFTTGKRVVGGREFTETIPLDAVPVYVRGGTILTLSPVVQHTRDLPGGPLEVHIYPGRDGQFTLTEDDGTSNDYLSGMMRKTIFTWDDAHQQFSWKQSGLYKGSDCYQSFRVTLHNDKALTSNEHSLTATGSITFSQ